METRQGSLVPIDRLPGGKLGGGGRWKKYENKSGKTMMGRNGKYQVVKECQKRRKVGHETHWEYKRKKYCNFPPQGSVFVESDRTFPFFQGLGFGKKKLAQNMPLVIIKHLYNVFHKKTRFFFARSHKKFRFRVSPHTAPAQVISVVSMIG